MASVSEKVGKDGRTFYEIRVYRAGLPTVSKRWYVPDGWTSQRKIEAELQKEVADLEDRVKAGKAFSLGERKRQEEERKALEALEAAKIKSLQQYIESVFLPTKERSMSHNGYSSYKMFCDKHIVPRLGNVPVREITPAMLRKLLLDFQGKGESGHALASCIKLYNILNGIFGSAFDDETITTNPMLRVKRPVKSKDECVKDEAEKTLTVDQVNQLTAFLETEPLKWRAFVALATDTGMRRGELCGLRWQDVDLDSHMVLVRNNLQYTGSDGVYETSCKNGKSRELEIGADVVALLKELKKEQASTCLSRYVFTQDGSPEPMFPTSPTRYFRELSKRCGIPHLHPHILRHTQASIALENGADVVSVSARLGHSDPSTTLRMYAHASKEGIKRAGELARNAIALAKKEG